MLEGGGPEAGRRLKWASGRLVRTQRLTTMNELIDEYLDEEPVQEILNSCARSLVRQRRLRTVDRVKWRGICHTLL
ncbi:hypothetical protein F4803DRAFT_527320, partial [Xylaria telfairii]